MSDAIAVAREHYLWCRDQGQSLQEIAAAIDVKLAAYEGEDDVLRYLELRWLQIVPGETQRRRARRAA